MFKKKILPLAVAAALLTLGAVSAEEGAAEKQEYDLDPVLVTAQRYETRDLNTPANTTVITAEDIKKTGAKTVFDVLTNTLGFSNTTYGAGGVDLGGSHSRTLIRGLDKGTLVLVNGAPLNLMNYNGTGAISIETVERIEVVKGAASVLYGPEALAGVVNIITKKTAGDEKSVTMQTSIGNYQSKLALNTQFGPSMLVIQRDLFKERDHVSRNSIISPKMPGYESSSADDIYFSTRFSDKLSFSSSFVNDKNNQFYYIKKSGDREKSYYYDDRRLNLNLSYDDPEKGFSSLLAFNNRRLRGKVINPDSTIGIATTYDLYNLTSDTQKMWHLGGENKLIAGLTLGTEHYSEPIGDSKNAKYPKKANRNSLGAYVSHEHHFTDRFTTTVGARVQHINDYAKVETEFLPQIESLYKINDTTSWFINAGKSHQMPALNQYLNSARLEADPFSNLKPQQGWTYETGLKIITPQDSWKVSVYHMNIKDDFKWLKNEDTNESYLSNAGAFKNTGVEVEYTRTLNDNWNINLGATISDPKTDAGNGVAEQKSNRVQTVAGINYQKNKFSGNLNYLFLGDRENSYYKMEGSTTQKAIADTHSLNATFSYRPNEKNEITLSLNNILDRDNAINKYERLDLPFNYLLNYSYKF
ncbi:MAG: TonB-dependent receptor [Sporomusaceae bacterium]|nr:TonB-dependent receptor [Sporomusaceae bacterium]